MPAVGRLRYAYLSLLSQPREDRALYRLARRGRVRSVLEIGMGSLDRAVELISVCQRYAPDGRVRYAGVDPFEERPADQPPLALIDAHRRLRATGAKVHLTPGGPWAVEAVANALLGTDLVLIAPTADDAALAPAWFYFPRMCHDQTAVLRGRAAPDGAGVAYETVSQGEIERRARSAHLLRAA